MSSEKKTILESILIEMVRISSRGIDGSDFEFEQLRDYFFKVNAEMQ